LLGVKIGKNAQIMPNPGFDLFFPELIEVGDGSIIGMECLILCHEFTTNEFKYGGVKIGKNVLVGARSIILPGIKIGDNSIIPLGTVVYKDVPSNTFAFGSPLQFKEIDFSSKTKKK
jgi:acetyltransferase-like isoleucine patch superfamily enzyme